MLGPAEAGGESDFQEVKYGATRETEDGCRARSKQRSRENTSAYFHNALSFAKLSRSARSWSTYSMLTNNQEDHGRHPAS
jgi:hypothetical protein